MCQQTIEPAIKRYWRYGKKGKQRLREKESSILDYQDENGIARVNVRFEGEDVWLNVEQMMELCMV